MCPRVRQRDFSTKAVTENSAHGIGQGGAECFEITHACDERLGRLAHRRFSVSAQVDEHDGPRGIERDKSLRNRAQIPTASKDAVQEEKALGGCQGVGFDALEMQHGGFVAPTPKTSALK